MKNETTNMTVEQAQRTIEFCEYAFRHMDLSDKAFDKCLAEYGAAKAVINNAAKIAELKAEHDKVTEKMYADETSEATARRLRATRREIREEIKALEAQTEETVEEQVAEVNTVETEAQEVSTTEEKIEAGEYKPQTSWENPHDFTTDGNLDTNRYLAARYHFTNDVETEAVINNAGHDEEDNVFSLLPSLEETDEDDDTDEPEILNADAWVNLYQSPSHEKIGRFVKIGSERLYFKGHKLVGIDGRNFSLQFKNGRKQFCSNRSGRVVSAKKIAEFYMNKEKAAEQEKIFRAFFDKDYTSNSYLVKAVMTFADDTIHNYATGFAKFAEAAAYVEEVKEFAGDVLTFIAIVGFEKIYYRCDQNGTETYEVDPEELNLIDEYAVSKAAFNIAVEAEEKAAAANVEVSTKKVNTNIERHNMTPDEFDEFVAELKKQAETTANVEVAEEEDDAEVIIDPDEKLDELIAECKQAESEAYRTAVKAVTNFLDAKYAELYSLLPKGIVIVSTWRESAPDFGNITFTLMEHQTEKNFGTYATLGALEAAACTWAMPPAKKAEPTPDRFTVTDVSNGQSKTTDSLNSAVEILQTMLMSHRDAHAQIFDNIKDEIVLDKTTNDLSVNPFPPLDEEEPTRTAEELDEEIAAMDIVLEAADEDDADPEEVAELQRIKEDFVKQRDALETPPTTPAAVAPILKCEVDVIKNLGEGTFTFSHAEETDGKLALYFDFMPSCYIITGKEATLVEVYTGGTLTQLEEIIGDSRWTREVINGEDVVYFNGEFNFLASDKYDAWLAVHGQLPILRIKGLNARFAIGDDEFFKIMEGRGACTLDTEEPKPTNPTKPTTPPATFEVGKIYHSVDYDLGGDWKPREYKILSRTKNLVTVCPVEWLEWGDSEDNCYISRLKIWKDARGEFFKDTYEGEWVVYADALVEVKIPEPPADNFTAELAARKATYETAQANAGKATEAVIAARRALHEAEEAEQKAKDIENHARAEYERLGERKAGELRDKLITDDVINATIGNWSLSQLWIGFWGGKFTVSDNWQELAQYDTPEQVSAVIDGLKAAIERGDKRFTFPPADEVKIAPATPDKAKLTDSLERALKIANTRANIFASNGQITAAETERAIAQICRDARREVA